MKEQLINPPREGKVLAHDVFGNTKEVPIKDLQFRISVYGVLRQEDKFLVQRHPTLKIYGLPGGAVELGEHLLDALIREFKEESGLEIRVTKLLGVKEDFFFFEEKKVHSFLIFYEVEKVSGELLTESNGEDSELAEFLSIEELREKGLQRQYLEVLEELIRKFGARGIICSPICLENLFGKE